jgi:hypothetical protein
MKTFSFEGVVVQELIESEEIESKKCKILIQNQLNQVQLN